ncbi:MAG: DUF4920 domain-containing protein [Myxococcales bacterium]|nr:DUF4920 domain-containing protein [Myxococcales bacterium]MCB9523197.1 DUF4920 domain-containing protein [Myxococcales bacterium]
MTALLMVFALLNPAGNNLMGDEAVVHRGAQFTLAEQITLDDIAKAPEQYAGKTVKVAAKITNVCRKKGCWMSVAGSTPGARARVAFKDYAFFAPFDATGKLAIIEGTVKVKAMSEAERKHLADDAGKPVSEIPTAELRLVASALEVRKIGH